METLKTYWDAILLDRNSTWILAAMGYVITGSVIRSWFLSPLFAQAKALEKSENKTLRKIFRQYSVLGYIFFILPLAGLVVLWRRDVFTVKVKDMFLIIPAVTSYVLSIICHLQAFGFAAVDVLKQESDSLKERKLLGG